MPIVRSRRHFLTQLGIAGVAGLGGLGAGARAFAAEPPPEVTIVTLEKSPATCPAPFYLAEGLLQAEGFTDVRYRTRVSAPTLEVAHNQIDWTTSTAADVIADVDKGARLTFVAGIHAGCYELIVHDHVHSIVDLKGKTVGWDPSYASSRHIVSLMTKSVGVDPDTDILWVDDPKTDPMALFINRKIDAFLASAPQPQELRARGIGHSLVNSATDRPWSQYFCCMLIGRTEFVEKYPIATKRILRALLKATDMCASEPQRAARLMVEQGFAQRHDYTLQTLQDLPYTWRDFDPEDTVRFFSLRLHEAGFIKSTPQRIIAEHTNWRFFNEVKRELKV